VRLGWDLFSALCDVYLYNDTNDDYGLRALYKKARTFSHAPPSSSNDMKTTTQTSQSTNHYGAVRGRM